MNYVAVAYSTKDRTDLTRQTVEPLLGSSQFDLWWFDGSKTDAGRALLDEYTGAYRTQRLTGGSCRYIVCALTTLLNAPEQYTHISLVENDVKLDRDWFDPTFELFEHGARTGLKVGLASARNYVDRVLIQRDGYSINHNLGAGQIVFTREAAEIVLQQYRTGLTFENRRTFSTLSGQDIGSWWAFRGGEHPLVADWCYDHMLAKWGLCSLALTPAKAEQLEDIGAMGLEMVREPVEARRDQRAFETFRDRSAAIRNGELVIPTLANDHLYDGRHIVFPHQIPQIGGAYEGDWRFRWAIAYGCFAWKAGEEPAVVVVPVLGPCEFLVSGGEHGGQVRIEDDTGFSAEPVLKPEGDGQVMQLTIPGTYNYRNIRMRALTPGIVFYGIRARNIQPSVPAKFDFNTLPPL